MSGPLNHSPAQITQDLLVDLGVGTLPRDSGAWPISAFHEPDAPDNCITVYDTNGTLAGRTQTDGETQEFHGLQFRVRSVTESAGVAKINEIATAIDTQVKINTVTIGTDEYIVYAITRKSGILSLGKDTPGGKRNLFTLNAEVSLRQQT